MRFSAAFQNWTTYGLLLVFVIFAALGFWRGDPANLEPYFANEDGVQGALISILAVLPIVPYYLTGFETIPKCSEEASVDFEPRRFLQVMLLAFAVGVFLYVTVVAVVSLLQPWQSLRQTDFATAIAFERAFGWPWLVQLIMLGAVLSLLKVFNGNFLAATRLLYAMGRRDLLGAQLGAVDERFQTPKLAIVLVGLFTLLATLLGRAVLVPISEVGSLTCVLAWLATCLAFCRGAGGSLSTMELLIGIVGVVVSALLVLIVILGFLVYHWLMFIGWTVLGFSLWWLHARSRRSAPATIP